LINCGDSRGLLVRNNEVVLKTLDHKPNLPAERDRITKAGGSVMIQRVNGSLAVSRALGDFEYKTNGEMGQTEQLVSPEPDVLSIERDPKDEFVVLACDGIWDVMSNEDIRDFVRDRLRTTDKLDEISNSVLDTCLNKVSFKYYI
jgi:protein phosphatase 1B